MIPVSTLPEFLSKLEAWLIIARPSVDNEDSDDIFDAGMNSMAMPSPALSGSDDESDGLRSSAGIRNWQSGTMFGQGPDKSGSSLRWDFANNGEPEDTDMTSGLRLPARAGTSSPAAVEIRVDEGDVAEAASGVDMSASSHMDELE